MCYSGFMSIERFSAGLVHQPGDERALDLWFEDVERHQYDLNRHAARRAAALADAVRFAREHPSIYAMVGDPDAAGTAERCAMTEAAARFQLSENTIRNLVHTADTARTALPRLWARAWEGYAALTVIDAMLTLLPRFDEHPAEVLTAFDTALADLVLDCPPALFRSKARRLADKIAPADLRAEHTAAFQRRIVTVEKGDAGMAWLHLHTTTVDALAIKRRLTSTAKHMQKTNRDGRTRDQLRADLATSWLRGDGQPAAVTTKVYVTVPLDLLAPDARATVRRGLPTPIGAPDLNSTARLDTGEPIDPTTAIRLLLEAGGFTRVITDPVTGVALDMDRTARLATRQQREWLLLTHSTCTRDGCTHPAAESDIDHWDAYHGPSRGRTDIGNLHPFCSPDNQAKEKSKLRYRRRPDDTVQLVSPTGYTTRTPRIGAADAALLEHLRANPPVYDDEPAF